MMNPRMSTLRMRGEDVAQFGATTTVAITANGRLVLQTRSRFPTEGAFAPNTRTRKLRVTDSTALRPASEADCDSAPGSAPTPCQSANCDCGWISPHGSVGFSGKSLGGRTRSLSAIH